MSTSFNLLKRRKRITQEIEVVESCPIDERANIKLHTRERNFLNSLKEMENKTSRGDRRHWLCQFAERGNTNRGGG